MSLETVVIDHLDGFVCEYLDFVEYRFGRLIPADDAVFIKSFYDDRFARSYAEVVCVICENREGVDVEEAVGISTGKYRGAPCTAGMGECPGRMYPPSASPAPMQRALPAPGEANAR